MRYRLTLIIILLFITGLRLLYIAYSPFDLSPDEAHYWEWSRRLDLSYYSKGPLVAYVIAFFTGLFGDTGFAVRVGAVVFSSFSYYFIYLIGRDLFGDEKTGFYAALLSNLIPLFSLGSILMTTDVLFIFFWAASTYSVKKALEDRRWWYVAGITSGLGFLAKYTMAFIYPCVLLFLLFSEKERKWLKRPEPYASAFIGLIVSIPVILWNIRNGQVTIKHTLAQAHVGTGSFSIYPILEFIGSQAGLITPVIFIGIVYGIWMCGLKGFREKRSGLLLAALASAPVFLFFLFKGLHGKVQANWAVASYVTGVPAAVWAYRELCRNTTSRRRRYLKTFAGLAVTIAALATALIHYPWAAQPFGAKKLIYGPPYNRIIGWRELGGLASEIKNEADKKGSTFIISDTYQVTSLLAMYMEGNPVTYNIDTGSRRMNQYDLWPGFEGFIGHNAIYVKGGNAEIEPSVRDAFESCEKKLLTIGHMGKPYREFTVFTCYDFKGMGSQQEGSKRY